MIYILYVLLLTLSALIGASLWTAFKPTGTHITAKQKATTLCVIAFGLLCVWVLYDQLGNAALVELLPY